MLYKTYKEKRNRGKRVGQDVKVSVDERWGKRLTENFQENKKILHAEGSI